MLFRQLFDHESSTYTYLLARDYNELAILIDPVDTQIPLYLSLLKELNLTLKMCIDTHVHADHITASGQLRELTGCDNVLGDETLAQCVSKRVHDDEEFGVEGITLKAIHTPGHTPDSYCFLMGDRVFTGDTLFIRGTGRTDFQGGSSEDQYDAIINKLLTLPENTLVYPGHDYRGISVSTIYEEKNFNPRLQVKDKAEYVELMKNLNLPKPKMIDVAVPANLKCGLNDNTPLD